MRVELLSGLVKRTAKQLDEIRALYSHLVALCAARGEALATEAPSLLRQPELSPSAPQPGAALPLREALRSEEEQDSDVYFVLRGSGEGHSLAAAGGGNSPRRIHG